jgi:hypothetical protein
MRLAQHNDMFVHSRRIDPINLSAKPFCQGEPWRDGLVADAHGSQSVRDGGAVDLIPITDQIAGSLIPRECLRDLACNPFRGRMRCSIYPDKVSRNQYGYGFRYTQRLPLPLQPNSAAFQDSLRQHNRNAPRRLG